MSQINEASLTNWQDGQTFHGNNYDSERSVLIAAINDNWARLIKQYKVLDKTGATKTTQSLTTAINTIQFKESDSIQLTLDTTTSTLQIAVVDGSVTTAKILDGNVTTAKLADGAVTTIKIADLQVVTAKIADAAVTAAKIANGVIDLSKLSLSSIDSRYYTESEIDTKLADVNARIGAVNTGTMQSLYGATGFPANPANGQITYLTTDYTLNGVTYVKDTAYVYIASFSRWFSFAGTSIGADLPATISRGLQKITASQDTSLWMKRIIGRTLINLLGNDGNCEDTSKFTVENGGSIALDSSNYVYGSKGIKATMGTAAGIFRYDVTNWIARNSGYYLAVADLKNGNGTNVWFQISDLISYGVQSSKITDTSKFNTAYVIYDSSIINVSSTQRLIEFAIDGVQGQYAYVDGIRLFKLSQADRDALSSMTADQIAAKYPYVDNLKNLSGVWIKRHGKNELPPFTEWTLHANAVVTQPYALTLNATGSLQASTSPSIRVIPNQAYSIAISVTGLAARYIINEYDSGGNLLNQYINVSGFTTSASADHVTVVVENQTFTGTFTFTNPMLNLGSTALPFEVQNDDWLIVDGGDLASSVDGTVYDELYQVDAVTFRKNKRFEPVTLDGSLNWTFDSDQAGYKTVAVDGLSAGVNIANGEIVIKYDGKPLVSKSQSTMNGADQSQIALSLTKFFITIAGTDSGWSDAHTPTQKEIQYFMNGWQYVDGTTWQGIVDSSDTSTSDTEMRIRYSNGFTPPFLQYQLAQAQDVPATVRGAVSLFDGDNAVEMGEGAILGEPVTPVANGDEYTINNKYLGALLKYKELKILQINRDEKPDDLWTIVNDNTGAQGGNYWADIPSSKYDPTAAYTVDYIAEPYQVSASTNDATATIEANLAETVGRNVQDIADIGDKVTRLDSEKANRVQGQWISPTLLNAWVNAGGGSDSVGYFKDEFGLVHIKGALSSGTVGTAAFYLPIGYRPKTPKGFPALAENPVGTVVSGKVLIMDTGEVRLYVTNTYVSIGEISFRAEQ